LLYGSLRARSYSRFLTFEAARLLEAFGADTRIFDPSDLPLPDDAPQGHLKVEELRGLAAWSEAHVWCSPERHGAMTGGGANAAFALLRSPGRRDGGIDEVYLFDARSVRLFHEPLFRTQGRRRKAFRASGIAGRMIATQS
jgi:hypothetical protein